MGCNLKIHLTLGEATDNLSQSQKQTVPFPLQLATVVLGHLPGEGVSQKGNWKSLIANEKGNEKGFVVNLKQGQAGSANKNPKLRYSDDPATSAMTF